MEQVFTTVKEVLRDFDIDATAEEALVLAAWPDVAGEMLHDRTRAVAYVDRRLIVEVKDVTWKRNLECLAPQMLAKLNRKLDGIKVDLVDFKIARRSPPRPMSSSQITRGTDTLVPALTAAAEGIRDHGLRDRFLAAAAAYLDQDK